MINNESWGYANSKTEKPTMKKFLLVTTAAIAFGAAPAVAADLPARPTYSKAPEVVLPVYDWSGFYIGINGGGGFSNNCWSFTDINGFVDDEGCHNATGGTVGGQIGYRWQLGPTVFGLEAQGNWADFRGDNTSLFFPTDRNQTRIDAFGLFTGQIGYAWNNALLYVKGGAAVTADKYNLFDIPSGALLDTASETRWGSVVGVGFEYGFAPSWSLGFEYDHVFMGSRDVGFFDTTGAFDFVEHIRQDVDLLTVRFNYKFGGPVAARY
jgi:outer membrane immunogenic protein